MAASTPGRHTATVLLVDDHPLMRKGLRTLLQSDADLTVVGEASDAREALEQVRALSPDVVVMGLTMPNMNGIDATRRILAEAPETRVVALSIHAEKRFVDDMLKAGASACVLKDSAAEELVRAIHAVLRGEAFLSGPILATVVFRLPQVNGRSGASRRGRHGCERRTHPANQAASSGVTCGSGATHTLADRGNQHRVWQSEYHRRLGGRQRQPLDSPCRAWF